MMNSMAHSKNLDLHNLKLVTQSLSNDLLIKMRRL